MYNEENKNCVVSLSCFFLGAKSMFFRVSQRYQNHLGLILKNVDSSALPQTYESRISEGLTSSHTSQLAVLSTVELLQGNPMFSTVPSKRRTYANAHLKLSLDVPFVSRRLKWNLKSIPKPYSVLTMY